MTKDVTNFNELWHEWSAHYRNFNIQFEKTSSKDGILNLDNPQEYHRSKIRPLFILRETNGFPGGDLREMLKDGPKWQLWHTVARWAAGMSKGFPPFQSIDNWDVMATALRKVAAINLKKYSGGASADFPAINAFAYRDQDLLRAQIKLINPTHIIACGTFDALIWLLGLDVNPQKPYKKPILDTNRDTWVVPFRHAARVDNAKTYDELKKLFNKIDV